MVFKILIPAFFYLFVSIDAGAQPAGSRCTIEDLSKKCSIYPSETSQITFSDGTRMLSPAGLITWKENVSRTGISEQLIATFQKAKVNTLSEEMKVAVANNPDFLYDFLIDNKSPVDLPSNGNEPANFRSDFINRILPQLSVEIRDAVKSTVLNGRLYFVITETTRPSDATRFDDIWIDRTSVTDAKKARARRLFEYAKSRVLEQIRMGRIDNQLSFAEKEALKKVKLVTLNESSVASVYSAACIGLVPNAFNDSRSISVTLCSNHYDVPDAEMVGTFGHEIGHSIDPCGSQLAVYKADNKRCMNSPSVGVNNGVSVLSRSRPFISYEGRDARTTDIKSSITGKCLTEEIASVPIANYAFGDVYQCLLSKSGGGFIAAETKNPIGPAFRRFPECEQNGNVNEAVADWFGSKAKGAWMTEHPVVIANDRAIIALGENGVLHCGQEGLNTQLKAQQKLIQAKDVHAPDAQRLDGIYLRDRALQKALGCQATSPPCGHSAESPKSSGRQSDTSRSGSVR